MDKFLQHEGKFRINSKGLKASGIKDLGRSWVWTWTEVPEIKSCGPKPQT